MDGVDGWNFTYCRSAESKPTNKPLMFDHANSPIHPFCLRNHCFRYMGPNLWDEVLTFGECSTLEFLNADDFLFETGIILDKDPKKSG